MNPDVITLTLNPALDVSTTAELLVPDHKIRCPTFVAEPGGGGVNVSRVCLTLGEPTKAIVALGGPTGARYEQLLTDEGISLAPIAVNHETRENFAVLERSSGRQFRFVAPGSSLAPSELDAALDLLAADDRRSRVLVVSGSMPNLDPSFFDRLREHRGAGTILVDTSDAALRQATTIPDVIIKPSARELAWLVQRDLLTEEDVEEAAVEIVGRTSIAAAVVSIGAGGAILAERDRPPRRLRAPTVRVESTVGAGDSLVAGLAIGLNRQRELVEACRLGIAAGTAAVLTPGTQLCRSADVDELLSMVTVD